MVACSLVLSACAMHMPHVWPFYKKPKAGPQAVNALNLVNADGSPASYPQYWKRNTLVIDLSGVSGTGSFAARLPEETTWPVRVAVRVRPGSVQQIEIQGEERNVLPVAPDGAQPLDLEFAPSVYRPRTAAIYISLGFDAGVRRGAGGARDARIRLADRSAEDRAGPRGARALDRYHRRSGRAFRQRYRAASRSRAGGCRSVLRPLGERMGVAGADATRRRVGSARPSARIDRGQRAAPHAPCIERQQILAPFEAERGPVSADHAHVAAGALRRVEPGDEIRGLIARRVLDLEIDGAIAPAVRIA